MFRKILLILSILFAPLAHVAATHAAEMVNVEYIHKLIERDWDITIPYNPKLENPKVAANMKYLLTAIDVANYKLNGKKTTDYGNGEFATMYAADTIATNKAVRTLIKQIQSKSPFTVTTTSTNSFSFTISAKGKFKIDWGDGVVEEFERTDTTNTTYPHTYTDKVAHTIGIDGQATGYSTSSTTAAISFYNSRTKVAAIDGSFGAIFPTIGDGSGDGQQPRFYDTFDGCSNLKGEIPENLFAGISGPPASSMFMRTFYGCSGLTGAIPAGLFGNLSGAPASSMFNQTFSGCSGLTGAIPAGLFGNLSGKPASSMFFRTFYGCSKLSGSIPSGLFGSLSDAPASSMFNQTFYGCSGLTGAIPAGLFGNLSGAPASSMFEQTFYGCSKLSGSIPAGLFGNLSGAPAQSMFSYTFAGCGGGTGCIPDGLFANIDVTLDDIINTYYTFNGTSMGLLYCSALPDIESKFFVTTTAKTKDFNFAIAAIGDFMVDWGDGEQTFISKRGFVNRSYSHTYATSGSYTIGIGGTATGYGSFLNYGAISFRNNTNIASIDGSLGAVFPTIGDGSGDGQQSGFNETFYGCTNLSGSIPENLFAGVSGAPVYFMFYRTFYNCRNLSGSIPDGLFAGISGSPASSMFEQTFYGCSKLTGIPDNLFGDISGTAQSHMFDQTFYNCTGLTGESAKIGDKYLYEIWPEATTSQVGQCYRNTTGLSDYSSIPSNWK